MVRSPKRDEILALMADGVSRTALQVHALMPSLSLRILSTNLYRMSQAGELVRDGQNRWITYRAATAPTMQLVEDGCPLARAWRVAGERVEQDAA